MKIKFAHSDKLSIKTKLESNRTAGGNPPRLAAEMVYLGKMSIVESDQPGFSGAVARDSGDSEIGLGHFGNNRQLPVGGAALEMVEDELQKTIAVVKTEGPVSLGVEKPFGVAFFVGSEGGHGFFFGFGRIIFS